VYIVHLKQHLQIAALHYVRQFVTVTVMLTWSDTLIIYLMKLNANTFINVNVFNSNRKQ